MADENGWWTPDTEGDQEFMDFMSGAAGDQEFNDFMSGAAGDQEFLDFMTSAAEADQSTGISDFVKSAVSALGGEAKNFLKKYLYDPTTGKANLAGLGTAAMALYSLTRDKDSGGYNKPVPKMDMIREQVQYNDPNRRPGESGRQYFTDPRFATQGDAASIDAAKAASAQQAAGLQSLQTPAPAQAENPWAGKMNLGALKPAPAPAPQQTAGALPSIPQATEANAMAHGGIAELAKGGRYLAGHTDGMADKIPSSIDGEQPAKLSHGEFVIPADVVSHLGNGNSEAGAGKLYEMMARVRKARTGNPEQGKKINPNNFMPGGLASINNYAGGGEVLGFSGETTSSVPAATGASGVPLDTSKTSTLSPWVGDYVTNALGQGAAVANAPYQAYQGPLTAGPSNLQQQAFAGVSEMAQTGYTPNQFSTGTFDTGAASQYMNPYLSAALDPQLKELQRQNQIANMGNAAQLTKAGAYGGSRQAVMNAENQRNMLDKTNELVSQGYNTAYDKAMAQYNADQGRQMDVQKSNEASRQYGADFGLKSLNELSQQGALQRGITSEGLAADKAQFEEQRDWAYKMPQYQLNLLSNLPIGASTTSSDQTGLAKIQSDISGLGALYQKLAALGQAPATPKTTG